MNSGLQIYQLQNKSKYERYIHAVQHRVLKAAAEVVFFYSFVLKMTIPVHGEGYCAVRSL